MAGYGKEIAELWGLKVSKRRPFSTRVKKEEWRLAARTITWTKKSNCRNRKCGRQLTWGDKSYEFDHKDNNPENNSQKNCYLVCLYCHRKATILKKRKIRGMFGNVEYKTIKKKVGYKKVKTKTKYKKKRRRRRKPKVILFGEKFYM